MGTPDEVVYSTEVSIFAAGCAILFCIVGIIGNLVTVLALLRYPRLRSNPTTTFVISLCVSDFLFCAINLPLTASRFIHREWRFGETMCKVFPVIFYGNVALSLLNMVCITINRYILIAHHHIYSKLYTKCSICLQMLSAWGVSFFIMLPPLLGLWGTLGEDKKTFSCTILKDENGSSPKIVIFLIGFFLPCVIIIIAYTCIYWKVRQSRSKLKINRLGGNMTRYSRRERDDNRLTTLMWIIFISFLFCFLPLTIVNVFDENSEYPTVNVLASILAWSASVINPFLYAGTNKQYRVAYARLLNLCKLNINISESKGDTQSKDQTVNLKTAV